MLAAVPTISSFFAMIRSRTGETFVLSPAAKTLPHTVIKQTTTTNAKRFFVFRIPFLL
jgi:hypothetical protein